jgi:hypothetical protein
MGSKSSISSRPGSRILSRRAVAHAYIDQISVREVPNRYRALLGMWRSGVVYTLIVTHITKPEFFLAFKAAFGRTFTKENILESFRGAVLIPYDPQAVLLKLDVRLRTPTPPSTADRLPTPWVSKTPTSTSEALSQSTLIKSRITAHQGSSPNLILAAVDQLSKGMQAVSHQLVFLTLKSATP